MQKTGRSGQVVEEWALPGKQIGVFNPQ